MSQFDACDECGIPMAPNDCYALNWTEWSVQDQRHIRHPYPGAFHGGCTQKAKARLDRERLLDDPRERGEEPAK